MRQLYLLEHVLKELDSPEWNMRSKYHDWKGYVPGELMDCWNELTKREKIIIAYIAYQQAEKEEWD